MLRFTECDDGIVSILEEDKTVARFSRDAFKQLQISYGVEAADEMTGLICGTHRNYMFDKNEIHNTIKQWQAST